jgi:hypothetical protein
MTTLKHLRESIEIKAANKGKLHKALGEPEGKKLTNKEEEVKPTDSSQLKKEKIFAQNAKKWNH